MRGDDGGDVTKCAECGFDWETPPSTLADLIAGTRDSYAWVADLDDDSLHRRPRPDRWSVLEYVAHLGDGLAWYRGRLDRIRTEDRPHFEPFDWDVLCAERRYNEVPVDRALTATTAEADRLAAMLRPYGDDDWRAEGVGSDGTPRSAAALARRAAHEVVHHLDDVQRDVAVNG